MKKYAALLTSFLIVLVTTLPTFVQGQKTPVIKSTKGKPATSKRMPSQVNRVLRRSSVPGGISLATANVNNARPLIASQSKEPQYVPDQILVQLESREETARRLGLLDNMKLAKQRNEALKTDAAEEVFATHVEVANTLSVQDPRQGDLLVLNLPADKSPDEAVKEYENKPGIKFAQKNWIYQLQQSPNDTEYVNGVLWGMFSDDQPQPIGPGGSTTNTFGSQAEKAWFAGHTGSKAVYVGIIDGGVQSDHPDLTDNIWINPGEQGVDSEGKDKATNGKDDDGNNRPDDVRGWDFVHQDGSTYDGDIPDEHGTHVAGTIGATGNNAIGVVGVNWNVTMIPAKMFGANGGTTDRAVEAIDYFIALKQRGVNVVAINNSWGGGPYDPLLFEAIKRAARAGILFIAAAGNYAIDTDQTPFYPACYDTRVDTRKEGGTAGVSYDSVISVAALEPNGDIASFSDFGRTTVDLAAPGANIMSTVPVNDYGSAWGTSMAAPHATGAVALYASTHPAAGAEALRNSLLQTVTTTASLNGKVLTGGRLNVSTF